MASRKKIERAPLADPLPPADRRRAKESEVRRAAREIVADGFSVADLGSRTNRLSGIEEVDSTTAWLLDALNDARGAVGNDERAVLLLLARRLRELFHDDVVLRGIRPSETKVGEAANALEELAERIAAAAVELHDDDLAVGVAAEALRRPAGSSVTTAVIPAEILEVSSTNAGVVDAMVVRVADREENELFVLTATEDDGRRTFRNVAGTQNPVGTAQRVARELRFEVHGEEVHVGPMIGQRPGDFSPYRLGELYLRVRRR